MDITDAINHLRNHAYMSGVERDKIRTKQTAEVFTPTELVREMLETIPVDLFSDPEKVFLDNACGDGQFLSEVLIRKLENGIDFESALSKIYGVELMIDNVELCRNRLLCGQEHLRDIVETNIVCHNAITFDYMFLPMTPERREYEKDCKEIAEQEAIRILEKAAEKDAKIKAREEAKAEKAALNAVKLKAKSPN